MKKLITISLFIFWAVVTATLVAGLVFYQDSKNSAKNITGAEANQISSTSAGEINVGKAVDATTIISKNISTLSLAEIAKHNSANDCWLLINNNVYDVSSFISAHPGGAGTIIPNCGKESTQAFDTKGSNKPHSASANAMLKDYYIGALNQVFNSASKNSSPASSGASQGSGPVVAPTNNPSNNPAPTNSATNTVTNTAVGLTLNLAEISKHNTRSDCWLLINNKVYNVSSFIAAHPGGAGTIIPNCGKESTQAFNTKGGNTPHSANANSMLQGYYIGDLNQQTNTQQIQQNVQNTNTVVPPTTGGGDGEGEDD
jgi:cytochrome b involved in lipid metabolism